MISNGIGDGGLFFFSFFQNWSLFTNLASSIYPTLHPFDVPNSFNYKNKNQEKLKKENQYIQQKHPITYTKPN